MEKLRFLAARIVRLIRPYRVSLIFVGVVWWRWVRPQRVSAPKSGTDTPSHILVVRLDAIGDLIMSSLIFRELRLRFPYATITAVVQKQCKSILETNPYLDRILSPESTKKSLFFPGFRQDLAILKLYREHLRHETIDLVVNPRLDGDLYSADILLKLVDCVKTFKYEETYKAGFAGKVNHLAFRRAVTLYRPQPRHEVHNNVTIAEAVTGIVNTSRPEVFLTEQDLDRSAALFAEIAPEMTVVSIALGAQAMRRVWPVERWAETIRLISEKRSVYALILCTNAEAASAAQLKKMLVTPSEILKGATLRQVAANIKSSDLFMGPDSGLAHLAAAVDCPVVIVSPHPVSGSLDHGNSPLRFGPFSDRAAIVQPQHGLAPCVTGCDAIEPHCILQVSPLQVAETCLALLSEVEAADSIRHRAGHAYAP